MTTSLNRTSWWFKCKQTSQRIHQASPLYHLILYGRAPDGLVITPTDPWPGDIVKGTTLLEGHFVLGPHVITFNQLWLPKTVGAKHLGQLHGFEWLRDLRGVGDNAARRLARQLISHWIVTNKQWRSFSWQPTILGDRITHWLSLYDFFGASADAAFHESFFKSLTRQVKHLQRLYPLLQTPFEQHCALKALIFSNVALSNDSAQLPRYLAAVIACLKAQIDDNGCHVSRTPEMQLRILKDLIDLRSLLHTTTQNFPIALQQIIEKITPTIRLMRHGDGGLAAFGAPVTQTASAAIDMALSLSDVKGRSPSTGTTMQFIRLQRSQPKNILVFMNVGLPQASIADDSLTHLNFEWSIGKERVIVQSDIIFENRAGFIDRQGNTQSQLHNQEGHQLIEAAYETKSFTHQRQIYLAPSLTDIRGSEKIESSKAALIKLRFLLAPQIKVAIIRSGQSAVLQLKNGQSWRFHVSGATDVTCETIMLQGPLYTSSQALILNAAIHKKNPAIIKWAFRTA
ncbi:MAG: heparinase II/III family protein [Alphaproteobacteria bacterium]